MYHNVYYSIFSLIFFVKHISLHFLHKLLKHFLIPSNYYFLAIRKTVALKNLFLLPFSLHNFLIKSSL